MPMMQPPLTSLLRICSEMQLMKLCVCVFIFPPWIQTSKIFGFTLNILITLNITLKMFKSNKTPQEPTELKLHRDTTHSRSKYEVGCEDSGGSRKVPKTTEKEYTDQESLIVGGSTIKRPMSRDAAKKRKSYVYMMVSSLGECSLSFMFIPLLFILSLTESVDEFDEWQSRVVEQNQQLDCIVEDMVINSSNMFVGDQPSRERRIYRDRQREIVEERLMEEYFVDNPTYDDVIFRRRFRKRRPLFYHIVDIVTTNDVYFQRRLDAFGRQNLTIAEMYCNHVGVVLRDEYLKKPTKDDLARLLYVGDQRGFPGMIGSIDCMYWQ
ncbi:hypothetical protein OSB04_029393 [Centaurea solstitialis]|uniref:Uncharacterized protein n=1 Tax=Centaurea solstitialis TaxID=347529 RepID=A0AA38VYR6_9ASTR|nr:hypothetical protein OSB04_029393 [Centaurea solstitialis]